MNMDDLRESLKMQLIQQLNLEGISPDDIGDDDLLFHDSGLGLDSIDALELIVMFEQHYGIEVLEPEESRKAFLSIRSMAEYITEKRV